jgi:hypothetical protein
VIGYAHAAFKHCSTPCRESVLVTLSVAH